MADNEDQAALQQDVGAERIRLGEVGSIGLRRVDGVILEESREDLRFPKSLFYIQTNV